MSTFIKSKEPKQQQTLTARRVKEFLSQTKRVMLIPKENSKDENERPIVALLFNKQLLDKHITSNIKEDIIKVLDDKYPVLWLDIQSQALHLALVDEKSGLRFHLPDQPLSEALVKFLKATSYQEKLALFAIAVDERGHIVWEKNISHLLLLLDGYYIEH